ncbi:hypothetical protein IJG14_06635 [bacterium]|nr:hypothetical protein [bacterium]
MYIFELLYKSISKLFRKKTIKEASSENLEEESSITCNHIFLPIDSTKKILACTKCGILIKSEELNIKQKNEKT